MDKLVVTVAMCTTALVVIGCSGSDNRSTEQSPITTFSALPLPPGTPVPAPGRDQPTPDQALPDDTTLRTLAAANGVTGNPVSGLDLPSIEDPLSQLGMKLFYSKSLGGDMDSACVTCHHPALGGGDDLSLGVGVEAIDPDILGPGRQHQSSKFTVSRNAPTTFNSALYRKSLFWDSRVMQLDGGIRTPESSWNTPDPATGESLLHAQARFPVTSAEEMRTEHFEAGNSNDDVRNHLAARLGGYHGGYNAQSELKTSNWLSEFQTAFGSSEHAEALVTYDNIAAALASYEASQVFVDNPWNRYLAGDVTAISDQAKRGAVLFFTDKEDGGAHCSSCHQSDLFSDEAHHIVAFPQIGQGKGDGATADDDFGLERETGNSNDRYRFRTPSLLNVTETAPYGHTGSYLTLHDVVRHYAEPQRAISFFDNRNWCESISNNTNSSCDTLFPNARTNTENAHARVDSTVSGETISDIRLTEEQIDQVVAFLHTLTDPCVQSRHCLAPWIPAVTTGPDGNQLNGVDWAGNRL